MFGKLLTNIYWFVKQQDSFWVTIIAIVVVMFAAMMIFAPLLREVLWDIAPLSVYMAIFGFVGGGFIGVSRAIKYAIQRKDSFTTIRLLGNIIIMSLAGAIIVTTASIGIAMTLSSYLWFWVTFQWQGLLVMSGALFILFILFPVAYEERIG